MNNNWFILIDGVFARRDYFFTFSFWKHVSMLWAIEGRRASSHEFMGFNLFKISHFYFLQQRLHFLRRNLSFPTELRMSGLARSFRPCVRTRLINNNFASAGAIGTHAACRNNLKDGLLRI